MSTPDTVRRNTPFNDQLLVLRTTEQQTPSTVRFNYDSIVSWSSAGRNDTEDEDERLPTFEACANAIVTAAERMVFLTRQPQSLAVAIAFDECMDIVTAAIAHLEQMESQGALPEGFLEVYRVMRNVRESLRPSSVRRSLQF
ncbi:hypothetical protein P3T76_014395 [Phytophthora citrophthora]|uniref:Uncharacterized protein n=1 Tax=Phytophthora citrophthora TaxID=4793 RepID=A0AAD9G2B8_9STRA|nr:hypothetical protein P3T76_014395 [Phytophthora citrophthora]